MHTNTPFWNLFFYIVHNIDISRSLLVRREKTKVFRVLNVQWKTLNVRLNCTRFQSQSLRGHEMHLRAPEIKYLSISNWNGIHFCLITQRFRRFHSQPNPNLNSKITCTHFCLTITWACRLSLPCAVISVFRTPFNSLTFTITTLYNLNWVLFTCNWHEHWNDNGSIRPLDKKYTLVCNAQTGAHPRACMMTIRMFKFNKVERNEWKQQQQQVGWKILQLCFA